MRYKPGHKQATRDRIMKAAGRLFRKHGYGATGVDSIMAEAGLTPGGFYAHFPSKEALLVESLTKGLVEGADTIARAAATNSAPFAAMIARYLNAPHRDDPASGCPLPCLTAEVARLKPAARREFTDALEKYLANVRSFVPGSSRAKRRSKVLATLSTLVGAMTLARAVADKTMSEEIFRSARHALLAAERVPVRTSKPTGKKPPRPRAAAAEGGR